MEGGGSTVIKEGSMGGSHRPKSPHPPRSPNEKEGRQLFPSGDLGFPGLSQLRRRHTKLAFGLVVMS